MVAMQDATRSSRRRYGLVTLELSTVSGRPVKKSNADVRMTEEDEKVSEIDALGWPQFVKVIVVFELTGVKVKL